MSVGNSRQMPRLMRICRATTVIVSDTVREASPSTSITLSKSRIRSPWGNCSPRTKPATSIHTTQMIQIDLGCILRYFPFGPVAHFREAISQTVGSQATPIKNGLCQFVSPRGPTPPKGPPFDKQDSCLLNSPPNRGTGCPRQSHVPILFPTPS